jgi:hypothetical protein
MKNGRAINPNHRIILAGHHSECHELRQSCTFFVLTVERNITKKKSYGNVKDMMNYALERFHQSAESPKFNDVKKTS